MNDVRRLHAEVVELFCIAAEIDRRREDANDELTLDRLTEASQAIESEELKPAVAV